MFRRLFLAVFGHFRLKLMALLIAVGVWFYADSRVTQEVRILAALEVVSPEGMQLLYKTPSTVRLRIAGPNWLVARIEGGVGGRSLKLTHQLTKDEIRDGSAELTIDADWLQSSLPDPEFVQIDFRGVEPQQVRVFVSPLAERVLPVKVRTSGEPAPGFRITEGPVAAPSEVTVRGPAAVLDTLDSIATDDVIRLWGERSDVRRELALRNTASVALDSNLTIDIPLELSMPTVVANVYISGEKEEKRVFTDVPIELRSPIGFPYEVEIAEGVTTATITVKGPAQEVKRLRPESVAALVNLGSLASQQVDVGATVPYPEQVVGDLPNGVQAQVVSVEPPRVTLLLKNPGE